MAGAGGAAVVGAQQHHSGAHDGDGDVPHAAQPAALAAVSHEEARHHRRQGLQVHICSLYQGLPTFQ